ncbi:alpha/beta hydrolase [Aureibacillus halotolerans]|uniref:Acetyl esterase/lipase n=1 Tax=Aureibacillus halotolerans TaxID=1508390 RepID=A0A4R6TUS9_9BACI|nr:alpha/beta hydrolase [Aureibacillus halotolerans]TDQ37151.1 acetyl esterase/lipase [Aureibacillus halotolerans]
MRHTFDYPVIERPYKSVENRELMLYIFDSNVQQKNRPAMLFFNGGSFKKDPKTPVQFQHQADYFSSKGMVAICVDYRNGSDEGFVPTQAICDVKSAVGYVRGHSDELGVDPDNIVVCGSSAGGYITVSSIMFAAINDDEAYDHQNKAHLPNYLIIFAAGMDGVDIMKRRYPQLIEEANQLSPIHHIQKCLPTTLWVCGTADDLYEQNKRFIEQMKQAGNDITLKTYEGMEHGFFNYGKHQNKYFHLTKVEMETYLNLMNVIDSDASLSK